MILYRLRFTLSVLAVSSLLLSLNAYADDDVAALPSRFDFSVSTSSAYLGGAQLDAMIPLLGDESHNFYTDIQAEGSSQRKWSRDTMQWVAGLGFGYRWIYNNAGILGAYIFGERTQTNDTMQAWVASPGIEIINTRWDLHMNGYLPIAYNARVDEDFADKYGLPGARFIDHMATNNIYRRSTTLGKGADVKFGYRVFNDLPLRATLGAYYFQSAQDNDLKKHSAVRGIAAGFDYWLNQYFNVTLNYSYDNFYRNTVALGLGVRFGGVADPLSFELLEQHMTDPIERHVFGLGRGGSMPSQTSYTLLNRAIEYQNIYFFNNAVSDATPVTNIAQCTFEHPCGPKQFDQNTLNSIAKLQPNALLFFNGGNYNAQQSTTDSFIGLTLGANQQIESRSGDYALQATDAQRTVFHGGFVLNSGDILKNIILLPTNSMQYPGISSIAADTIEIENVQLGDSAHLYPVGFAFRSATHVSIKNSDVFSGAVGMLMQNSQVSMDGTRIQVIQADSGFGAYGINILDVSQANITNSSITVSGNLSQEVQGVAIGGHANVSVQNSTITVNGTGDGGMPDHTLYGMYLTAGANVTVENSDINVHTFNQGSGDVYGVYMDGGSHFSMQSSKISVSEDTLGLAILDGLTFGDEDYVTLNDVRINLDGAGLEVPIKYPIFNPNFHYKNITCYNNGVSVKCI